MGVVGGQGSIRALVIDLPRRTSWVTEAQPCRMAVATQSQAVSPVPTMTTSRPEATGISGAFPNWVRSTAA